MHAPAVKRKLELTWGVHTCMAWLAVNKSAGGGSPIRTENPGPLVTSRYRRGGARCSAAAGKTITRLRQSRCAGWLRLRALPWRGSGGPRQRTSPLVTSTTSRSTPPAAAASEVFFFFLPNAAGSAVVATLQSQQQISQLVP